MKQRGRKICLNCKESIGARTMLCPLCGYDYKTQTIRKDFLDNKKDKVLFYDKLGPGRKMCPECQSIIAAVRKVCPKCNCDFVALKKQIETTKKDKRIKKENKEEKISPPTIQSKILAQIESDKKKWDSKNDKIMTPDLHADRIIEYGEERAKYLYNLRKSNGGWKHVNWKKVAEYFKFDFQKEEIAEENEIKESA